MVEVKNKDKYDTCLSCGSRDAYTISLSKAHSCALCVCLCKKCAEELASKVKAKE